MEMAWLAVVFATICREYNLMIYFKISHYNQSVIFGMVFVKKYTEKI